MSQSSIEKSRQEDEKAGQDHRIADREPDSGYLSPTDSTFDFEPSSGPCSSGFEKQPRASTPKLSVVIGGKVLDWDISRSQVFQRRRSLSYPGLSLSSLFAHSYTSFNPKVDTADAAMQTESPPPSAVHAAAAPGQPPIIGHVPPNNHLAAAPQQLGAVHVIHAGPHHEIAIEYGDRLRAMGDMLHVRDDFQLALNAAFNHPLIAVRFVVDVRFPVLPPWARNAVRWLTAIAHVLLYADDQL